MKNLERKLMFVVLASALLGGCGGGGGDDAPPPRPGPTEAVAPEASQSSAGLVKYLTGLAAALVDDKEPLDLGTFSPVTPDDTEPEPLG